MPRNTIDELIAFTRFTLDVFRQGEIEDAIAFAHEQVEFICPATNTSRSTRSESLRKRAELLLAAAECYDILSPYLALTTEGKEILSTLGISIGTDFPTPIDYQSAFAKAADRYRERGMQILKMISPINAIIE